MFSVPLKNIGVVSETLPLKKINNLECTIQQETTGIISHPEWLISKEIPDKKVYSIGKSLKMCFRVMGYNKIYLSVI